MHTLSHHVLFQFNEIWTSPALIDCLRPKAVSQVNWFESILKRQSDTRIHIMDTRFNTHKV